MAVINNSSNDYDLTIAAFNGNPEATKILWNRYRLMMIGIIGKYNNRLYQLSNEELESEAVIIFMHKLRNVFKPEKIRKHPNEWSFSYMLTGGSKNQRSNIINKARNYGYYFDDYNESETQFEIDFKNQTVLRLAMKWDDYNYKKYNPEAAVIDKEWESVSILKLNSILTPFQKAILKLRRAGMSIRQIADHMGCGFTKIRLQIIDAKEAAQEIICA